MCWDAPHPPSNSEQKTYGGLDSEGCEKSCVDSLLQGWRQQRPLEDVLKKKNENNPFRSWLAPVGNEGSFFLISQASM